MDDVNMEPSNDNTDQKSVTRTKVNGIDKMEVVQDKVSDNIDGTAGLENSKMNGDDCMSEMSADSENSRGLENGLNNPCAETDISELQENPDDCNSRERDSSDIGSNENSNSSTLDKGQSGLTPSEASGSCAENLFDSLTDKTKADYSDVSQDREDSTESSGKLSTSNAGKNEVDDMDHSDNCDNKQTLVNDTGLADQNSSSDVLKKESTVESEVSDNVDKGSKDKNPPDGEDGKNVNGTVKDSDATEKKLKNDLDISNETKNEEKLQKTGSDSIISDKKDGSEELRTVNSSEKVKVVSATEKHISAVAVPNYLPSKSSVLETVGGPRILVPAVASVNSLLLPKMSISGGTHLSSPSLAGAIPQPPFPVHSKNLNSNNALTPDKAQSSIDMLLAVKKQVEFGSRTPFRKSKLYDPKGELGPTAKFLFNIGQEVVKDRVYSSMIKIQDKRDEAGKLSDKEKKDLEKLKEIHKDVYHNVKDLILDANSRCFSCHFTSDLNIVLENHKQYPHTNEKGNLCLVCKFTTTTWQELTFHMQLIHNLQPITMKKAAAFECSLCPYENNSKNKLFRHKTSCFKNFQIAQNLAPSWLNNDMNFALTDCFYKVPQKKPITPRPLPLPTRNVTNAPPVTRPTLNIPQQNLKPRPYLYQYVRNQNPTTAPNYRLPVQPNIAVSQTPLISSGSAVRQNFVPVSVVQQGPPRPKTVEQMLNKNRPSLPPKPQLVVTKPATTFKLSDLAHSKNNAASVIAQTKTVASSNTVKAVSSSPVQQAPPQQGLAGFVVCEICGGYVKDRPALKVHLFYAHNISLPEAYFNKPTPPLMCEVCSENFWTIQGLQKHRKVRGHTPGTASTPSTQYCSLCGLRNIQTLLVNIKPSSY